MMFLLILFGSLALFTAFRWGKAIDAAIDAERERRRLMHELGCALGNLAEASCARRQGVSLEITFEDRPRPPEDRAPPAFEGRD